MDVPMLRGVLGFVMCLATLSLSCRPAMEPTGEVRPETRVIEVAGKTLRVELAITPEEHRRGLQERRKLDPDAGMLFIFETTEADITFWMDRTYIPLSVAFIDAGGIITQIEDMEPLTRDLHRARFPTRFVLEVNRGWFVRNGVNVGDRVDLSGVPE